ncbi:MAG: glutamine-hydrolyzing carbamoyl-phosphate synthase small subunit [Nanoarchaeota archaeon]
MRGTLVLEDGSVFEGVSFGYGSSTAGEVVFSTAMVGYPQSLTDPSYCGQILCMTYPLIGNYGIPGKEREHGLLKHFESERIHVQGLIVSEHCSIPSHHDAEKTLADWLKEEKIPALSGIDTRALTQKIRERGVMLGKIVIGDDPPFYDPDKENLVAKVSRTDILNLGEGGKRIVLVDCGAKHSIIRCLLRRDASLTVVPWDFDFNTLDYDGLMVSNGPGDPTHCQATIANLRKAMAAENPRPIFGICMGNQLLALAAGAKTYKLKYGHRSHNQPVIQGGRAFVTTQNHGFAVDAKTLPQAWEELFVNNNDGTNEGIRHKELPFFSAQFHPEANAGPRDTEFLFDQFLALVRRRPS